MKSKLILMLAILLLLEAVTVPTEAYSGRFNVIQNIVLLHTR